MSVKKPPNSGAFFDFLRDQIASINFVVSSQAVLCKLITMDGEAFKGIAPITTDRPNIKALKVVAYEDAFKRFRLARSRWLFSFYDSEI